MYVCRQTVASVPWLIMDLCGTPFSALGAWSLFPVGLMSGCLASYYHLKPSIAQGVLYFNSGVFGTAQAEGWGALGQGDME
jgi:hypothetical protein